MIERHKRCIGIKLFSFRSFQIELWFCPGGERIESHIHKFIDSTLIILGGSMYGRIGERSGPIGWNDFGRRFLIPAGTSHDATITGRFCIFANVERWSTNPTSAAIDFIPE